MIDLSDLAGIPLNFHEKYLYVAFGEGMRAPE